MQSTSETGDHTGSATHDLDYDDHGDVDYRYQRDTADGGILVDAAIGAVAGALGVWAMDRLDWFMFEHEDAQARGQTQQARPGGMDPAHVAANKVADAFGVALTPRQPHPAGMAVHYSLGVGPGAIYSVLQDRVPYVDAGRGALWGATLFVAQDEILNAATGLSGRPQDYPWQAHGRGLVAHMVYGVVTDTAIRAMKGWMNGPRHQSGHR